MKNKELLKKVAKLEAEIQWLKKQLFGSKSERKPIKEVVEALDLFKKELELASTVEDEEKQICKTPKKRLKEEGRQPLAEHFERYEDLIELPENECICEECGTELKVMGEEITKELEFVPAKMRVRQIKRLKYACPKDTLHKIVRARMPERIIPKGMAGPSLLAHILVSKYVDHLPLYRQTQIFNRLDIHISRKTMSGWMGKTFEALEPLLKCLKSKMLESKRLNCDETTFKVQRKLASKKGLKKTHLWSYIGDEKWVWFDWQEGRGKSGPLEVLKDFKGESLQSDGYVVYDLIVNELKLKQLGCWAHVRRKFVEAWEAGLKEAKPIVELIAKLYMIESFAKEKNLVNSEVQALREAKARPILNEIKVEFEKINKSATPAENLGKATKYLNNQWDKLTEYCTDGALLIDNNIVERSIRPATLGRKNYLFAGSENGAKWIAGFYSLVETCKLHGVEPGGYLTEVLRLIVDYDKENLETLLPDAFALKYGSSKN
jgi:transposase